MSTTEDIDRTAVTRPRRADAQRNHDKVVAAAREAFAERGASTSLEEVARRAGVGIGTLYRHFPTRQALVEAVYLDEVQALCTSAEDFAELPPWEALHAWLHRFVAYMATKHALAEELQALADRDANIFQSSRAAFYAAGEPLLRRAQEAHAARLDTDLPEVIQMLVGIAKIPAGDPAQTEHILEIALDGLRYREERPSPRDGDRRGGS